MATAIIRFFMGKGGVGKTTCAAAYALRKAREGHRTLIVSLDPAHNLGDVLGLELGDEPRKITENLMAIEVDYDAMVRKHLKELSDRIKDIYGYLRVFNLDRYVDVLQHSPGVEEQAALEKILEIVKEYVMKRRIDVLVFDTPPTGLTLRIMALPEISLIWIEKLMQLRLAILERRKAITRILGEEIREIEFAGQQMKLPIDVAEDPIFKELEKLRNEYSSIRSILTDSSVTGVVMVINPETLPVLEAKRAYDFLKRLSIPVKYLVVNKVLKLRVVSEEIAPRMAEQERALNMARQVFMELKVLEIPYLSFEPRGIEALEKVSRFLEGVE